MIEYFELDFEVSVGVSDLEEEPLRVAIGIDVVLQEQVVLMVCDFGSH